MESQEAITQVLNIVQSAGMWVVFLYLYVSEKKSHNETREQYRKDLREISGLRQNLVRVDGNTIIPDKSNLG